MLVATGLCKVVQGSFNQGDVVFEEVAEIRWACIVLFAISYSTFKGNK